MRHITHSAASLHLVREQPSTTRHNTLELALRSALAQHRSDLLSALLLAHGPQAFARALSCRNTRQLADALSQLSPADRAQVYCQLPPAARRAWLSHGKTSSPAWSRRMARACQRCWSWLRQALPAGKPY